MEQRHGSPVFYKLLEEMADIHDKKSHDYANNTNPSGNYHFAGQLAVLFSHSPQDAGFVGRLAEKIYRLSVLEGSGKEPKNESIEDTERDIAVIATLWMADRRSRKPVIQEMNRSNEVIDLFPPIKPEDLIKLCDHLLSISNRLKRHKQTI